VAGDFAAAFEQVDLILGPVAPTSAPKLNDDSMTPLQTYLADIYTIPANLAGLPGISIPCGFADGMPVGMQLIGNVLDEATILRAAYTFEQATGYHKVFAPLGGKA
jgi:aspartyl-tRNA(Asn)/glutamyl-tRNA(Gln) amidotransferase subunit A